MSFFHGFRRKAFVIVESEEIYNERIKRIENEDNKETFLNMIHNMKGLLSFILFFFVSNKIICLPFEK
jgi:hypothetical protein